MEAPSQCTQRALPADQKQRHDIVTTKCHHHEQMWLEMGAEIEVARYAPLPKLPQAAERVASRNETSPASKPSDPSPERENHRHV